MGSPLAPTTAGAGPQLRREVVHEYVPFPGSSYAEDPVPGGSRTEVLVADCVEGLPGSRRRRRCEWETRQDAAAARCAW